MASRSRVRTLVKAGLLLSLPIVLPVRLAPGGGQAIRIRPAR